jgi:serine/threonine-protein phosphatase PGAM5
MRTIILVRHGQYDLETGSLTGLGRQQTRATARALKGLRISAIHSSTLPRAQETAAILRSLLRIRTKIRSSSLLREALPTPLPGRITPERRRRIQANFKRMCRAFEKLMRPARSERIELVVAHGNLIRLFVCLALRSKPATWLKMGTHNCGATTLVVTADKGARLVSYNEIGHLPRKLRTVT